MKVHFNLEIRNIYKLIFLKILKIKFLKMFKNLLLEDAEDNWSSGGHEDGDIQVSISDFDSPKVNVQ